MKRIVVFAVLVLSLAGVGAAAAAPPTTTESHWAFTGTDTTTCGISLASTYSVDVVTRTFVDRAGVPVRTETLNRAEGTLVGPNGQVARFDQVMNTRLDLATNVQTSTGVVTKVVGSNGGVLLSAVGRLVLQLAPPPEPPTVLATSGRPQLEPDAYAAVCEYLISP